MRDGSRWLCFWIVVLMGACGGDDEAVARRGSPACQDFQDALCDFTADRCHTLDRGSCDAMLSGIECVSDADASRCANAANEASCGQPVRECDLLALIDSAPAVMGCQRLRSAVCAHASECGLVADRETCESTTESTGLDCTQAISVTPELEQCLDAVDAADCSTLVPNACRGAVGILPPSLASAM